MHTFANLFLLLLTGALPFFLLGILAGWMQWSFLAGRTMRAIEKGNNALREQLRDSRPPVPN